MFSFVSWGKNWKKCFIVKYLDFIISVYIHIHTKYIAHVYVCIYLFVYVHICWLKVNCLSVTQHSTEFDLCVLPITKQGAAEVSRGQCVWTVHLSWWTRTWNFLDPSFLPSTKPPLPCEYTYLCACLCMYDVIIKRIMQNANSNLIKSILSFKNGMCWQLQTPDC